MDLLTTAILSDNPQLTKLIRQSLCKNAYTVLTATGDTYTETQRQMAQRVVIDGEKIALKIQPIVISQPAIQNLLVVTFSDITLGYTVDILGAGSVKTTNETSFTNKVIKIWLDLQAVL